MKKGHWMPIDKRVVTLFPKDRQYTEVEALLSLTADRDNGIKGSINGYSALWGWSRNKVRRFVRTLESGQDYLKDWDRTDTKTGARHPIRLVFNNLERDQDRGQDMDKDGVKDSLKDTTIDPESSDPKILNPLKGEEGDKGASQQAAPALAPHSMTFDQYKRIFKPENEEAVRCIDYFLQRRRKYLGMKNPLVYYPETWERYLRQILYVGNDTHDADISWEECKIIIDKYFDTGFQDSCDYALAHFMGGEGAIRMNRFYEEIL